MKKIEKDDEEFTSLGSETFTDKQRRKTKKKSKFSGNRIQTMYHPESGWCRWDEDADDYIYDPSLN